MHVSVKGMVSLEIVSVRLTFSPSILMPPRKAQMGAPEDWREWDLDGAALPAAGDGDMNGDGVGDAMAAKNSLRRRNNLKGSQHKSAF